MDFDFCGVGLRHMLDFYGFRLEKFASSRQTTISIKKRNFVASPGVRAQNL